MAANGGAAPTSRALIGPASPLPARASVPPRSTPTPPRAPLPIPPSPDPLRPATGTAWQWPVGVRARAPAQTIRASSALFYTYAAALVGDTCPPPHSDPRPRRSETRSPAPKQAEAASGTGSGCLPPPASAHPTTAPPPPPQSGPVPSNSVVPRIDCARARARRFAVFDHPQATYIARREFRPASSSPAAVSERRRSMDLKDSERRGAAGPGPLSRQGSIYSLTFDEFQNTLGGTGGGLGKDFGSMNMDELLRSIWTAEESQAMASASEPAAGAAGDGGAALQRQGSLTLPRTLSVKTVDEVWRDFAREGTAGGPEPQPNRQPTLGEMTLEDFLVRAGVVRDNPAAAAAAAAAVPAQPVATRPLQAVNNGASIFFGNFGGANDAGAGAMGFAPVGIGDQAMGNGLMPGVAGMAAGAVTVSPVDMSVAQLDSMGKGNGDLSSPMAPVPYPFEGVIRGRRSGAGVEKVVERRQRRMIKNRESAARSRARKQAYTMELEAEVQKLKEQNEELQKKQEEIMEMQKNQVVEVISNPYAQKKRCLRRTLTGPW
ncbi:bZIP transcription factor TRAB1 [Zea mays]|nr:bZIP transcription factor TRAB1 [Zea mays]